MTEEGASAWGNRLSFAMIATWRQPRGGKGCAAVLGGGGDTTKGRAHCS